MRIARIEGDGIGPDVTRSAFAVAESAVKLAGAPALSYDHIPAGADYFKETGRDIVPGGEDRAGRADAIFVGAIGHPDVRHPDGTEMVPHLRLRDLFGLYAGVRPVRAYPNVPQRLSDARASAIDLVILRESTEGLFYSAAVHGRGSIETENDVSDTLRITRATSEKLFRFAFNLSEKRAARGRPAQVTCVDKANVFASMAFFRRIFDEVKAQQGAVDAGYSYVDAMALDLVRRPWDFGILVTENMFGDILSDLAGGLVGGMGMAACAEIGDAHGLFQPAHGSAPDISGQDLANPLAAVLSAAMMLDYLADRSDDPRYAAASVLIEDAVEAGFTQDRLRPIEFGGDMGTRDMTRELLALLGDPSR